MSALLLINPNAGGRGTTVEEVQDATVARGVSTHVLAAGEDAAELARRSDAEVVGVAGGDGSLSAVAAVAVETGRPLVCVPVGTRNHFARDLGLDQTDLAAALDAFAGDERRVDVARVGERLFLNNVSLGAYAALVHRREHHRRRRQLLARARALWLVARERPAARLSLAGAPLTARIVVVANNGYELDLFNVGERATLTEGKLHLYMARGLFPTAWEERAAERFRIDAEAERVAAAVDGEPVELPTPLEFRVEPQALRVLVPQPPR
jgi:diacylglycerol kinase family enzyme